MTINEVQTRLEAIQQENPAMNAISIITEETEMGTKISFNIIDLQGKPHIYFHDDKVNVLDIYEELKSRSKKQVNPNQLIGAINRKIHEARVEAAKQASEETVVEEVVTETPVIEEVTPVTEVPVREEVPVVEDEFVMEMPEMKKPAGEVQEVEEFVQPVDVIDSTEELKMDETIANVPVIEEVKEQSPLFANPVEQVGDIVPATNVTEEPIEQVKPIESPINENVIEPKGHQNTEVGRMPQLISIQDFYRILDVGAKLDEKTRMQVELWYAYLGELMIYEDFLNVELKDLLNGFRNYVIALQISDNMVLNMNQVEACERLYDLEERKSEYNIGMDPNMTKNMDKAKVLTLSLQDNAAFVAYVQIFAIVFSIATVLSALVIYVVSK